MQNNYTQHSIYLTDRGKSYFSMDVHTPMLLFLFHFVLFFDKVNDSHLSNRVYKHYTR